MPVMLRWDEFVVRAMPQLLAFIRNEHCRVTQSNTAVPIPEQDPVRVKLSATSNVMTHTTHLFNCVVWDDPNGELANNFAGDNGLAAGGRKRTLNSVNTQTWESPPDRERDS